MTTQRWEKARLKHVAPVRVERLDAKPTEAVYVALENIESWSGKLLLDAPIETVEGGVARFESGDVLFGKLRPYLAKVGRPNFNGVCSTELVVLQPQRVLPKFLQYFLLTPQFIAEVNSWTFGTKMPRVSPDRVLNAEIHVPPIEVQRAIVRFLDQETARIDALITQKELVLARLEEWRRSLAAQVFSDYDEVEWQLLRRHVLSIEQGISPLCDDHQRMNHEWAVLKLSAVSKGTFNPSEHKVLPPEINPVERYEVRHGDLLITRSNTPDLVGDVCVVKDPPSRLLLCDLIYRVSLANTVRPDWVALFLSSPRGRAAFKAIARGSSRSMVKIRAADIRDVRIPLPSLEEQESKVVYMTEKANRARSLRAAVENQRDLLTEYRSALITDAVTGQIDVGSAA